MSGRKKRNSKGAKPAEDVEMPETNQENSPEVPFLIIENYIFSFLLKIHFARLAT